MEVEMQRQRSQAAARSMKIAKWVFGIAAVLLGIAALVAIVLVALNSSSSQSSSSASDIDFSIYDLLVADLTPQLLPTNLSFHYDIALRFLANRTNREATLNFDNMSAMLVVCDEPWAIKTRMVQMPPLALKNEDEGTWFIRFRDYKIANIDITRVGHVQELMINNESIPMTLIVAGLNYERKGLNISCRADVDPTNIKPPVFSDCQVKVA